jgi:hypothetical protein
VVAIQELNPGNQWNPLKQPIHIPAPGHDRWDGSRVADSGAARGASGHMGGFGSAVDFDGKAMWQTYWDHSIDRWYIPPISHLYPTIVDRSMWYIQLYPLYPRCCLTQAHFASQAFHKSGVLPRDNAVTKISAPVAMGSVGSVAGAGRCYGLGVTSRYWKPLKLDGFI